MVTGKGNMFCGGIPARVSEVGRFWDFIYLIGQKVTDIESLAEWQVGFFDPKKWRFHKDDVEFAMFSVADASHPFPRCNP